MPLPKQFSPSHALAAWVLVLILFFGGCRGKSNELRIERQNFEKEIAQEQNLVFTFDKALVSAAQLQKWDTINYLTFTPAVKGRYKWTAPNELVFSPLQPFAPSTDFQAELSPELLRHSEKKYKIPADANIRFHTPYLNLAAAKAFWAQTDNSTDELEARVGLEFNYPVAFSALRDYLHVYQGQKEVPIELVSGNPQELSVKLKNLDGINGEAVP